MEDLKQQYLDELKRLSNLEYHDEIKIAELTENFNGMSIEIQKKGKASATGADYTSAITPDEPVLSTKEPDNSLSMEDEHLDTISATESDEFINESEGIPEHMCNVHIHDNSPPLDVSKDQIEYFSESNEEFSSIDENSFSIDNIDYVDASLLDSELVSSEVMEIVIPEVGGIDDDIFLTIKDDILCEKLLNVNLLIAKIEALNANPTPSSDCKTKSSFTSLTSLLEETNTFDNSLPEFELSALMLKRLVVAVPLLILIFLFQNIKFSMTIMLKRSVVAVPLLIIILLCMLRSFLIFRLTHFLLPIGVIFMSSPINSFPSYRHQSTIVSSSRPDVSHRCGTVKKFNTHRSHLNECPMLIHGKNTPILDVPLFHFYPS
nr:hypothetical protein [Tanacetum cinerariifolium]